MTDWSESDLEHLANLESTIKESLRGCVGDGEGLDAEVLSRYRESVRRAALTEAADAAEAKANGWRRWQEVRPHAPGRPTAFGAEKALDGIADHIRSLLTTTKETDNDATD
jgi:hypothetical protein